MSWSVTVFKAQIFSSHRLSCDSSWERLLSSYFRNILSATAWLVFLSNHSGFRVGLGVDHGDLTSGVLGGRTLPALAVTAKLKAGRS